MNDELFKETVEKLLKPCPFCAGYAAVEGISGQRPRYWIKCKACGATQDDAYTQDDYVTMVNAWNRRVEE